MTKPSYQKYQIKTCRICASSRLYKFLDLGSMPIPNGYLEKGDLKKEEPRYPLSVCVCEKCFLVQLTHVVPPEIMFKNYLYIPSTSQTIRHNFRSLTEELITKYQLKKKSLVIDIGSNDGTLLGFFQEKEMKVIGIDPASNLAQVAQMNGIPTVDDFFSIKLAKKIVKEAGLAKIITSTNCVAHMNDLVDFCQGLNTLLDKDGVAVLEFPYLLDLFDKNEFDTIYHEHLSYFSVLPLSRLFTKNGLKILDIIRIPIHGGSLRIYLAKKDSKQKPNNASKKFIQEEKLRKLDQRSYYDDFSRRVKVIKRDLVNYLKGLKKQKKKIVGYGASAKGNVLMNYCQISSDVLNYIVDSIPYKQGKYTPGNHIPIYPEIRLIEDQPDYALLLSWNFSDEILVKQRPYREKGGRFIITIPYLRIE